MKEIKIGLDKKDILWLLLLIVWSLLLFKIVRDLTYSKLCNFCWIEMEKQYHESGLKRLEKQLKVFESYLAFFREASDLRIDNIGKYSEIEIRNKKKKGR